MVRHILMLDFKDGFTQEENRMHAQKVKEMLEALPAVIPGILSMEVVIDLLPSSNRNILLNSLFSTPEALADYQTHPAHIRVSQYVGTVMTNRSCIDFLE